MNAPVITSSLNITQRVTNLKSLYSRIQAVQPAFTSGAMQTLAGAPSYLADNKMPDVYKVLHFSQEQKELIEQTVGFIEFVSKAVSTVTAGIDFADSLLKLLGLVPSPEDKFKALFEALKAEIQKVQDAVVQDSYLQTMQVIDSSLAKAKAAAQAATVWVQQGKPSDNGVIHTSALLADTSSREAVDELMTKSRWLGLFDRQLYLTAEQDLQNSANVGMGPWTIYASSHPFNNKQVFAGANIDRMSDLVPREEGNMVWDYRVALPAFLFAVSARLTVLQAHFPDFGTINQVYLDELKALSSFLATVLQKLETGIWTMPLEQWLVYSGFGPACCHYCCDVYTGQCLGADKIQDMNFLNAHWDDASAKGKFMLSRYLAMLELAHTPVLSAMASLAEISNVKSTSTQPPVPPQKTPVNPAYLLHPNLDIRHAVTDKPAHLDAKNIQLFPKK